MSSFGNTRNLPPPKQKPLNVDEERASTNEQARPVPYFAGIARLGVTFLSEAFDVYSTKVQTRVGKKKQTTGYNYFASFAALLSHGPIDRLDRIFYDDELVWEGPLTRSGDFSDITVPHRGKVRVYWGTESQGVDPILAGDAVDHPAYRGQAYLVFEKLFFGENRTNAPQIEVVAAQWPRPSWLTADEAIEDDANPVAVLWDLWTNARYGLGLPEDRLNLPQLNAVAEELATEGVGVSPVITRAMSYRQFLIELCECFDGHPTSDHQGRLGLGLVRAPGEVTTALADADLVEPPDFDPQGWPDTFNETYVRFTNRDRKFKEDSVAYRDRGNFQVTQAIRSQILSRPWVTRAAVATKIAWAAGRAAAMPVVTGNLRVRKSKASGLAPGGLFKLSFSQNGIADLVARVESITHSAPDKSEVSISFREDRGFLNADLALPAGDAPPEDTPIETAPLSHQAIVELPYALLADNQVRLGVLAARGDSLSTGMNIWVQQASGAYVNFGVTDNFAMRGHLVAEYPAETRLVDEGGRFEIQFDSADRTLDDELALDDALDNTLLLFAGAEILSGFDVTLIGTGHYRLSVVRARYDTKRQAHPVGEEVFVIRRADLPHFLASRSPVNYKLQPFILQHELDLASIAPLPFTLAYRARRPFYPLNLRVNGDGRTPTYGAGAGVSVNWDRTDPRRAVQGPTAVLVPAIERTVVELLTVGGVLRETFTYPATGPQTITNAQIVAALGAETDFVLRAWFEAAGRRSLESDQITVRKV
jgi:hypothetical protein